MKKPKTHTWHITIDDGFGKYGYTFQATRDDIAIHDITEIARKLLGAKETQGSYIPPHDLDGTTPPNRP